MSASSMSRTWLWIFALVGLAGWMSWGCIVGAHHQRMNATVDADGAAADVEGTVESVDLGLVADFRYLRLGFPFEGQRRRIAVDIQDGGRFEVDQVVEMRALRLDVPVWSFRDFSEEPSGHRYPGLMRQRESLELWVSGSVGVSPINPGTASVGLVYYRYGAFAARLYGGASFNPFEGLDRSSIDGVQHNQRRSGYAPGIIIGLEMTLAAGEYALELAQFILELDRDSRDSADRWD